MRRYSASNRVMQNGIDRIPETVIAIEAEPAHGFGRGLFLGFVVGATLGVWLSLARRALRPIWVEPVSQRAEDKQATAGWRGSTWNRPMKIDPNSLDPLTVSRMTDHNVTGGDSETEPQSENRLKH